MTDAQGTPRSRRFGWAGTLMGTVATVALAAGLVVAASEAIATRAAEPSGAAAVQARPLDVRTAPLVVQDAYTVQASYQGRVEAARQAAAGFEAGGTVAGVLVDEGARVRRGELLARLDTRALVAERAARVAARDALAAQVDLARLTANRQRALADRSHASAQRLDEARLQLAALEAQLDGAKAAVAGVDVALSKAELRAPFDARVGRRYVDEGAQAGPGQPVLDLMEVAAPRFRAGLPEAVAAGLAPGDVARLRIGDGLYEAALVARRPEIDPATRTVAVLFELPPGTDLPDGSLGQLEIAREIAGRGAWVPLGALSEGLRGLWTVYVVAEGGDGAVARREAVELIHAEAGRAFVRGAFGEAARVVAAGTHRIADGQRVRVAQAEDRAWTP